VLALTALARSSDVPAARDAFKAQLADSRKNAVEWQATHPRPTPDDYGVAMKDFKLPTPDNLLAILDQDGYLVAAVQIARGVATGNAAATVEGLGKLAPPNSSLRIASEGTAAALRGDIPGTARAVLALAQKQDDVSAVTQRLRSVEGAVAQARAAAGAIPTSVKDVKERGKDALPAVTPLPSERRRLGIRSLRISRRATLKGASCPSAPCRYGDRDHG
jgi:hypothetical protein